MKNPLDSVSTTITLGVVFAIIVLHEKLPGNETMMVVIGTTVMLSVLLHGMSATPLSAWIGGRQRTA